MDVRERVEGFCRRYGLRVPILQAPMSGACPPELAIAVAEAGGMGGAGVVQDGPEEIAEWARRFRAGSDGPFQMNLWIPDPPREDRDREAAAQAFLGRFGNPGEPGGPVRDFEAQCEAVLRAAPTAVSSIMGLFLPEFVARSSERGIAWFACATTLDEASAAEDAGADVIVAQGAEAGGHRGSFDPDAAERAGVGLFALLPQIVDRVRVPVVATGGIADGRGVAAALTLGASAVQIGSALLRCPETAIHPAWGAALEGLAPEDTVTTRAYTGRLGRGVPTGFVSAWTAPDAPPPARYPAQRRLVARWRRGDPHGLDPANFWAGQAAGLARPAPAGEVVRTMWEQASTLVEVG